MPKDFIKLNIPVLEGILDFARFAKYNRKREVLKGASLLFVKGLGFTDLI
jgi:hypothetical protein